MGTYDIKQVLADYENGTLTAQMATGHGLQHIQKLYEAQTTASISHYELRGKVNELESALSTLQTEVARLAGLVKKLTPRKKRKTNPSGRPPEA
jgi:hypothetical protein